MLAMALALLAPAALAAQPSPATALFPERPSLDAIAPSRPYVFKQETWTEIRDGAQHCHEWAFPARDEAAIRAETYATLARLGITSRESLIREDGVALSIGPVGSDVRSDAGDLIKLTACTEGQGTVPALRAYLARLSAEAARSPTSRAIRLEADAAWERIYARGARQIGMRVRDLDEGVARPRLERAGFRAAPGTDGAIDLVRAGERVRFIGSRVWWQTDLVR